MSIDIDPPVPAIWRCSSAHTQRSRGNSNAATVLEPSTPAWISPGVSRTFALGNGSTWLPVTMIES